MKQTLVLFIVLWSAGRGLWADEFSNNLNSHLNEPTLNALTEDLGAVVGAGSFHQGKAVSFPFGFDLGLHVPIVGVQKENKILSDDKSTIPAVWGQLEIGLPGQINVIGRTGEVFGADLIGGGVRYGISAPGRKVGVNFSVSGLYNKLKHSMFDVITETVNLVVSIDLPFIRPYVGGGFDRSRIEIKSRDLEGKADGYRAEAGINFSVFPFSYIVAGLGLANGEELYHFGVGVKI